MNSDSLRRRHQRVESGDCVRDDRAGTWSYYVVAFDKAGNISGASNSVAVKV